MMQETQTKLAQLQIENNSLNQSVESAQLENEELKKALALSRQESAKLGAQLELLTQKNLDFQTQSVKLESALTEKKSLQNLYTDLSYKMKRREVALGQVLKKSESMKAQNQKLTAENDSYQSARLAFEADKQKQAEYLRTLENQKEEQAKRLSNLTSQKEQAVMEIEKSREDIQRLKEQNRSFRAKEDAMNEKMDELKTQQVIDSKKIEELKKRIEAVQNDTSKVKVLTEEKEKLLAEGETMKKAMVDLEHEAQTHEDRFESLNSDMALLREENESYKKTIEENSATIEALKADNKQSLDDMQNLKNNFQSYLESMVTSFQERQNKAPAPAASSQAAEPSQS
jgi:chromosome segregation ATPase